MTVVHGQSMETQHRVKWFGSFLSEMEPSKFSLYRALPLFFTVDNSVTVWPPLAPPSQAPFGSSDWSVD